MLWANMPFGFPDTFIAKPLIKVAKDAWQNDDEKKKGFGIELARNSNPFEAALIVFTETNKALWVSVNWVNDPVVINAKLNYLEQPANLLDKDQLATKLLVFADEKITFNGNKVYAAEAKDRLAALRLYAEVKGFIGKTDVSNTTFVNNGIKITFVNPDPEKKEEKIIEHKVEEEAIVRNPIKLKLVS